MNISKMLIAAPVAALLGLVACAPALAASPDAPFVKAAASGNLLEIKAGSLAEMRAASPEWKNWGTMMVKDHTTALAGIKTLAKDKSLMLPMHLAPADQASFNKLSASGKGSAFDMAYAKFNLASHKATNALYEKEIAKGQDSDVRAVAAKQLPVVQNHLQMVDKMTMMSTKNLSAGAPKQ